MELLEILLLKRLEAGEHRHSEGRAPTPSLFRPKAEFSDKVDTAALIAPLLLRKSYLLKQIGP